MILDLNDTIAAIASAPGPSARGIVRLSGDSAIRIAVSLFESAGGKTLGSVELPSTSTGSVYLDKDVKVPDAQLTLWPGRRTYTAQPMAEIHTIGCEPILLQVLGECTARGARLALPGEFTLRAFLGGRIDLTQAEAVHAAVTAQNPHQLDAALAQLAGGMKRHIEALRSQLVERLALLEATLDFAEEPDVAAVGTQGLAAQLDALHVEIEALLAKLEEREQPQREPRVVLTGPPNVGKSRLFNALVGIDHALVADQPGTTRDFLQARCTWNGFAFNLVDTAGREHAGDSIQAQAQTYRAEQSLIADLVLLCRAPEVDEPNTGEDASDRMHVWTKCDIDRPRSNAYIVTSAATGEGLDKLKDAIRARLCGTSADQWACIPATGARCRDSLQGARDALLSARHALDLSAADELVALELRIALDRLGTIVGAITTDELLGQIFGRFCVGK